MELVRPKSLIAVDERTTNMLFALLLPKSIELRAVTNSFITAEELRKHPNIEVIFLGGTYNKASQVTTGKTACHEDLGILLRSVLSRRLRRRLRNRHHRPEPRRRSRGQAGLRRPQRRGDTTSRLPPTGSAPCRETVEIVKLMWSEPDDLRGPTQLGDRCAVRSEAAPVAASTHLDRRRR